MCRGVDIAAKHNGLTACWEYWSLRGIFTAGVAVYYALVCLVTLNSFIMSDESQNTLGAGTMTETVLITGGAGYIGSHACVVLLEAGFEVVVLDNLSNSHPEVFNRVERIAGRRPEFIEGDIRDHRLLQEAFASHDIGSVMHFAGLKSVGESVSKPLEYYQNNVGGTLTLLEAMEEAGVRNMVFSSSATVYGDPESVPISEDFACSATNPYGRSKLILEEILADWQLANPGWSTACLRYFNPVGAHVSGLIGEDPQGIPNNLMPYVAQVAVGRREKLAVFGGDYPTPDGTGVRDYIHVMDLVEGHLAALRFVGGRTGLLTVNLGTGNGASVLEIVSAYEQASAKSVPYEITARRAGDIAECWADTALAVSTLDWRATRSLLQMCEDSWRWQSMNPRGYE
jgi:UDP-glucose 4-epimerase